MAESQNVQNIVPYLYYEDGSAALEYLCKTFGFDERMAVRRGDGSLLHGEVEFEGNVVMIGTPVDADGVPKRLREQSVRHASIMCYLDDVDAHYARAKAAGARITSQLADQEYGARSYTAEDLEGLHWHFATRLTEGGA